MPTIESEKITIGEVFNRWYRIPEYQRPYRWDKDQISVLFDDLTSAHEEYPNEEYFLGSIVLHSNNKNNGQYIEYDLLDGQQRLTTLFLLLAVARDISKEKTQLDDTHQATSQAIYQQQNVVTNTPERLRIAFDFRERVQIFINKNIRQEGGTLALKGKNNNNQEISIRHLYNAIIEIKDYLEELNKKNKLQNFIGFLFNKVVIISVVSNSLEDAFKLFTIMNDRGLKLRASDILKAKNLSEIENEKERKKYATDWENWEDFFGEDFDTFLSYIRTIIVKEKARSSILLEFEENIYKKKKLNRGKATFSKIEKYQEYYSELFQGNRIFNDNFMFNNLITVMKKTLLADLWIPPLLYYYDKFKEKNLLEFLIKLDNKCSADWISSSTPTKRNENMNLILKEIKKSKSFEELEKSGCFKFDEKIVFNTLSTDIFQKRFARYILYKLDFILSDKQQKISVPQYLSVEHILPQNPADDSQWCKDFKEQERKEWTNKLGNLVLISRIKNSSQGRRDYKDKKENYFKKNINTFPNSIRVMSKYENWTLKEIKENHDFVLKKLKEHYK